jgi:hypothetical protein
MPSKSAHINEKFLLLAQINQNAQTNEWHTSL